MRIYLLSKLKLMLKAQVQESHQGLSNFNSDLGDWLIFLKIKKRFQKRNRSKEFRYSSGGTRASSWKLN